MNYAECNSSEEESTDKPSSSSENSSSEFRYPRRQRKEVNYMECEEGPDDDYLFCDDCNMDYPGDCPVHGPLIQVKDTPVPLGDPQRANKTVPDGLCVGRSTIKGAQYGVFTLKRLSKRLCFGPYEGVRVGSSGANGYTWQIRHGGNVYLVDGRPLDRSNWMRYVNCAPQQSQQNLVAFVRRGAVHYRTNRVINAGEELFVWYGDAFAKQLGLIKNSAVPTARNKQGAKEDVATPQVVFSCEDCGDMFSVQKVLDYHRRCKHHQRPQGKHRCAHCPYSSNNKQHVIKHERIHTGERPFVCHVCRRGFTQRSALNSHLLVHTAERPYECPDCGQRFTHSSTMEQHQRALHSGNSARPYVCSQCGKGFTRSYYLSTHLLIHTGAKPHACSVCGMRFTRHSTAKRHEIIVHGRQYPLHCPHCGKGCWDMREMRKHTFARHCDDNKENSEA
ncbi:histone-lysine N-methyltransferase PRDM9 [Rhipicephalus sanguineus]|uniref:histone-lysine N-methyltransferase PRDM9 n=1 Tax=Rhipicephalus sanguineus TaxID=34632 RepID=UPI0020C529A7|nr:histone-lysine N-methyltransferase PRDM9 [Rhipicephalus sanguineus]